MRTSQNVVGDTEVFFFNKIKCTYQIFDGYSVYQRENNKKPIRLGINNKVKKIESIRKQRIHHSSACRGGRQQEIMRDIERHTQDNITYIYYMVLLYLRDSFSSFFSLFLLMVVKYWYVRVGEPKPRWLLCCVSCAHHPPARQEKHHINLLAPPSYSDIYVCVCLLLPGTAFRYWADPIRDHTWGIRYFFSLYLFFFFI